MTTLRITSLTDPIDSGVASAAGTYVPNTGSELTSVAVIFRDSHGNEVSAAGSHGHGVWAVDAVDVSTLVAGEVLMLVTVTADDASTAFDAAATAVRGTVLHVTGSSWATHADVRQIYDPIPDADVDAACWIASDILFKLTGSRWPGICHVDKLRPQASWRQYDRPQWWQNANWMPLRSRTFSRYGWCSCNRGRDWGCNSIPEIMLPHRPVHKSSIVVMLDGNQFDGWDLRDDCWLQRTDLAGWPCCQQTQLPDTQPHTWSVSYSYGQPADAGGVMAAAALGFQLALAYSGNDRCQLPQRIQHLTRGGTSIALIDPLTLFQQGLTGISEVDLWVASKMIGNTRRPATVHAVGKMPRFRKES